MTVADGEPVPSLHHERTALAWQRAALALTGLGLVAGRLAWPMLGGWAVLPAAVVVAVAGILFGAAHRRYRRAGVDVRTDVPATLPDGRLPLVTAATVLVLGVTALAVVLGGQTA